MRVSSSEGSQSASLIDSPTTHSISEARSKWNSPLMRFSKIAVPFPYSFTKYSATGEILETHSSWSRPSSSSSLKNRMNSVSENPSPSPWTKDPYIIAAARRSSSRQTLRVRSIMASCWSIVLRTIRPYVRAAILAPQMSRPAREAAEYPTGGKGDVLGPGIRSEAVPRRLEPRRPHRAARTFQHEPLRPSALDLRPLRVQPGERSRAVVALVFGGHTTEIRRRARRHRSRAAGRIPIVRPGGGHGGAATRRRRVRKRGIGADRATGKGAGLAGSHPHHQGHGALHRPQVDAWISWSQDPSTTPKTASGCNRPCSRRSQLINAAPQP